MNELELESVVFYARNQGIHAIATTDAQLEITQCQGFYAMCQYFADAVLSLRLFRQYQSYCSKKRGDIFFNKRAFAVMLFFPVRSEVIPEKP